MANSTGVYQLKNGNWMYRVSITVDGVKKDTTCRKKADGSPFRTKTEAKQAREDRLVEIRKNDGGAPQKIKDITLEDTCNMYLSTYSKDKATSTVVKYSSIWKNHVKPAFGKKKLSQINVNDMYGFLLKLYGNHHL